MSPYSYAGIHSSPSIFRALAPITRKDRLGDSKGVPWTS